MSNIVEVDANLLEYQLDGFGHQANCFCTMGAGIAASIKSKYPEAYEADLKFGRSGENRKLGKFSVARTYDEKFVYNLYGQYNMGGWKRQTNYDALCNALTGVKDHALNNMVKRLGFPRNMGCVLGGGDWRVVKALIESVFEGDPDITVYICNYTPNANANISSTS
jgi:O-acetyl-ADP-ribose deacetylase (regulator of RNase III)